MLTVNETDRQTPNAKRKSPIYKQLKGLQTHQFATTYWKQECSALAHIVHSKTLSVPQILIIIVMMWMIFTQVFLHNPINRFKSFRFFFSSLHFIIISF